MFIDAGEFRHRVEIFDKAEVKNQLGQITIETIPVNKIWCKIIPLRGFENIQEEKIDNQVNYKIITRYNTWLKEHMFIMWKGKEIEITKIYDVNSMGYALEIEGFHEVKNYVKRE